MQTYPNWFVLLIIGLLVGALFMLCPFMAAVEGGL